MTVRIECLSETNLHSDSLDGFIRHQEVTECWRCTDGAWHLAPIAFVEEWDAARLKQEAANLSDCVRAGGTAFGAFSGQTLVGFAQLGERLGTQRQYLELVAFQVSQPWRGQGIGKRLFRAVCAEAHRLDAKKLYISAHSSRESQAAYRALGCVPAQEIDPVRAAAEPCDVQMEYDMRSGLLARFGTPDDLSSWMALVRRVAWNFPGLETEAALEEHAATVSKFISKGNAVCAVEGDTLVGVLLFSRRLNMLCCMAVVPECRRHGAAQAMFDLMQTIADPARDLTVTTFRENDPKGDAPRAFYRKQGFIPAELVMENEYPCQRFVLHAAQRKEPV